MNPLDPEGDGIGWPELLRGLPGYLRGLRELSAPGTSGADVVKALLERGNALLTSERYDDAIAAYDTVLSIAPATFDAWNDKGFALSELDRDQEAVECFTKALAINRRDATAWRSKGVALCKLRSFEDGLQCLDAALALDDTSAAAWLWRGVALSALGRLQEAAQAYTTGLKYAPPSAESDVQSIRDSVLPDLERRIRERG
jgi:tetratricopeptide (TPR) repeat protein